jgi:hypothetical protein
MRQVLSTAIVAVIVSLLTLTVAGALAQSPEDQAIEPAAVGPAAVSKVNADKVDGKHAVGYTTSKTARKGKLVATNTKGLLPPNIVKPPWSGITGMPAGFADGIDNAGVTGVKLIYVEVPNTLAPGAQMADVAWCPPGTKVAGGGFWSGAFGFDLVRSQPRSDFLGWIAGGRNTTGGSIDVATMAICMQTTPSGALTTATR